MADGGDYYDIDDILAEAEELPSKFRSDAYDLGFLDASSDEQDLKAGTRVELPYWLAIPLARRGLVSWELPKAYDTRFRTRLAADPRAVDLASHSRFFYEFGSKLHALDAKTDVSSLLREALLMRFQQLIARDTRHRAMEYDKFVNRLPNAERTLWDQKGESDAAEARWRSQKTPALLASYVTALPPATNASAGIGAAAAPAAAAAAAAAGGSGRKRKAED